MTDAQRFIDSSLQFLNTVASDVERAFDNVANQLRDSLSADVPFMPRIVKPPPPPPTTYQIISRWISKHKALTAAVIAFALTGSIGSVVFVQSRRHGKKRRAARSTSGARTEVVVIAGSISSPLASTLALDLERRGYIVYTVAPGPEAEQYVRSLQRADLLSLPLNLADQYTAQDQLSRFWALLDKEHIAFERAEPHKLSLKGLVFVPDTASAPSGLIEDISSEEWSDALYSKLMDTFATTQIFLPLLKQHAAKLLLLTPSVTSSITLPAHSVENTMNAALQAFFSTCAAEIHGSGVSMVQFKLGDLDIPSISARQKRAGAKSRFKPTPLRKLHDSVFDALAAKRPSSTWYVGRGSFAYHAIGSLLPGGLIGYLMRVGQHESRMDGKVKSSLAVDGSSHWESVEKDV